MFVFTSFGAKVKTNFNNSRGPLIFKISGQVHHLMGSLIPLEGDIRRFTQLCVYDTEHEVQNRMITLQGEKSNSDLDPNIVRRFI